jgi:hypothetical protein
MPTLSRLGALLPLLLFGCSGGGAASPSAASMAPTAIAVVSGETGEPVAGAMVTAGGRAVVTDAAGRAALEAAEGLLTIEARGFLLRETALRPGERSFTLWPLRPDAGEGFLTELVYNRLVSDGALARPAAAVAVALSEELAHDAAARAAHERAAALIGAANGAIPFEVVGPGVAASVLFQARVDPGDPVLREHREFVAVTRVMTQDHRVVGGSLSFRTLQDARQPALVAHEMGHAFGLGHSSAAGLMAPVVRPGAADFSTAERLAMRMMAQRRPGNRAPDNDVGVRAASAGALQVFGCE